MLAPRLCQIVLWSVIAASQVLLTVGERATTPGVGSGEALPPGWESAWNDEHKRYYYFKRETGETTWIKPEAELEAPSLPDGPLPNGWESSWSVEHNQYYYFNRGTGETTWDKPLPQATTEERSASQPISITSIATLDEGVGIEDKWMDFLYETLDADGQGGIDEQEWTEHVIGQWANPMWSKLDENGDKKIEEGEFKQQWDPAVSAAFKVMGGDDQKIEEDEIDAWIATDHEKEFAKTHLRDDEVMDRGEFEEFIYTVMAFRALGGGEDNSIGWEELKVRDRMHLMPEEVVEETAFTKAFGTDGMQLQELYDLFKAKAVFLEASPKTPLPEGVNIENSWMDFLYDLIDKDGNDGLDNKEFFNLGWPAVVGGWAAPMWSVLDEDGDQKIDKQEFENEWDPAVTAAFKVMGGDDGKIEEHEIDVWKATPYEKEFAKKSLLGHDHIMDRSEFEEFLYTAMMFRGIDGSIDGSITWIELASVGNAKAKAKLGFDDEPSFAKYFGDDGIQIEDLYDFCSSRNVFTRLNESEVMEGGDDAGVEIESANLGSLYDAIDNDGKDGISMAEWTAMKGTFQDLDAMWLALDKDGDQKIDKQEFEKEWDPAVTAAFKSMGGGDGKIEEGEIDAWGATAEEKDFAKKDLLGHDHIMDRSEFEEFIYTDLLDRAESAAMPRLDELRRTYNECIAKNIFVRLNEPEVTDEADTSESAEKEANEKDGEVLTMPVPQAANVDAVSAYEEATGDSAQGERASAKAPSASIISKDQKRVCSFFHQHRLARGEPEPTWFEARPAGQEPFAKDEEPLELIMLCPEQLKPEMLNETVRDKYSITKDDTLIVQIAKGENIITTWFLNLHDITVMGPRSGFVKGSEVVVKRPFQGNDKTPQQLEKGMTGVVKTFDKDGDVDIVFTRADGSTFEEWVLKANFYNLKLKNKPIEAEKDMALTLTANLGPAFEPTEAYPMMGSSLPRDWHPTALEEFKEADCRLHSKFYWLPTPESQSDGSLPLMGAGKMPGSKYAGRRDLVSTVQCCRGKCASEQAERPLYKVFL